MRDFPGLPFSSLPDAKAPDFQSRTRNMFGTLDAWCRDMSVAVGLLANNRQPEAGGANPVVGPGGANGLVDGDYGDVSISALGTRMRVDSAAQIIYVKNVQDIQTALDSLTSGGIVQLEPGTYTLTAGLNLENHGLTLRGAGKGVTKLLYTADANTDIVTIKRSLCTIEDLTIQGSLTGENGSGGVGTGRGVVIAQPNGVLDGVCHNPTLRRVEILCTGSWCYFDTGSVALTQTGSRPDLTYSVPTSSTGMSITVQAYLEDCSFGFPNSDGVLYAGSGAAAYQIKNLKTNSYSYNKFTETFSGSGNERAMPMGACFFYNVVHSTITKPILQSPSIQAAGTAVDHYDNDATMMSFLNSYSIHLDHAYHEVLSANCLGTHPDGGTYGTPATQTLSTTKHGTTVVDVANATLYPGMLVSGTGITDPTYVSYLISTNQAVLSRAATDSAVSNLTYTGAGRVHWFITGIDSHDILYTNPYFRSTVTSSGTEGYALRILRSNADPGDPGGFGVAFNGGTAVHKRTILGSSSGAFEAGDPSVWDRDDFVFAGPIDGEKTFPIKIHDFTIQNNSSGNIREPSTPSTGCEGATIILGPCVSFSNNDRARQLGIFSSMDGTGGGDFNDLRARWSNSHVIGPGVLGYVFYANPDVRNGLYLSDSGNDFRQIPFIRYGATFGPSTPVAGDIFVETDDNYYLKVYDGSAFQTWIRRSTGTAAGDLIYYTASDTPTRRAIGTTGDLLTVAGGVPTWAAPEFSDSLFRIKDNSDPTKKIAFEASGIPTATTRTITVTDEGTLPFREVPNTWTDTNTFRDNKFSILYFGDTSRAFNFDASGISASTTRVYTAPNATGTLALIDFAQTWGAIQTFKDTFLSIVDDGDVSKEMRFQCSGITASSTRNLAVQDMSGSMVVVGNTTSSSGVLGRSHLTGQTGSIGSTTLLTGNSTSAGIYRVTFYLKTTTTGSGGDTVKITVAWDDGTSGPHGQDVALLGTVTDTAHYVLHGLNTSPNWSAGHIVVYAAASTDITFTTTVSAAGSPQYAIDARIEALG